MIFDYELAMIFDYELLRTTPALHPHAQNLLHPTHRTSLVEVNGIEPMTSCLQSTRSPN